MNERKENKTLDILLKVFLAVGIVAGIAVTLKIVYDRYKKKMAELDDDFDCNFECLENDGLDCDCDSCEFAHSASTDTDADVIEEA